MPSVPVAPVRRCALVLLLLAGVAAGAAPVDPDPNASRWWADVQALSGDDMQGRMTGSPEYRRATEYVARVFEKAGLAPGGSSGYFQPVSFVSRTLVPASSSLALERDGVSTPIAIGDEAIVGLRYDPASEVSAPLVFVGYGLSIPGAHYDDLAGLDLRGAVAVVLSGTPEGIPGDLLAHAQSAAERWRALRTAGAVGAIAISPPASRDIPWDRMAARALGPTLRLADPALDDLAGQQIGVSVNDLGAAKILAGSGHDLADLAPLAARHAPLPRFALPSRLRARIVTESKPVEADNVVGVLPGSDPARRAEHVVLSAHLDHVGVGEPVAGDRIYNGAMDNASGVATLLEAAREIGGSGRPPARSLVFLAVAAEEQGLLGSRYWAARPTVARPSIVADVNVDMFLPLYPMKSVLGLGAEESDLGDDLRRGAAAAGVTVIPDPEPARRRFIRSDQYSFIREGIPSLALKVGYEVGTPEHELVKEFMSKRYHAPSDDLAQPIDRTAAASFNRLYVALARAIADRETRPAWKDDSFFNTRKHEGARKHEGR